MLLCNETRLNSVCVQKVGNGKLMILAGKKEMKKVTKEGRKKERSE
jgi:hypothetical protein